MSTAATAGEVAPIRAGAVVRPGWRRARLWVALAAVVLLGAIASSFAAAPPGRPLDPDSARHQGSRALAQLLRQSGTTVRRTTSLTGIGPGATVVIAFPDSYGPAQLRALAGAGRRLVLPADRVALGVLAPGLVAGAVDDAATVVAPGCADAGPWAAGEVRFPAGTQTFTGAGCYGGRVSISPALVVIGPGSALTNARLGEPGVAALDLNAITADGTVGAVTWLLPGPDATGAGRPSVWQLLPGWAPRASVWLMLLGVLVAIWRSRRMGPVVYEPLPVVVRAAEIVEGHGRLYRRARARDSAAATLRQATRRRLARAYGLPAGHTVVDVVSAVSARTGRQPGPVADLLDGPAPAGDADLIRLAGELRELESGPRGSNADHLDPEGPVT